MSLHEHEASFAADVDRQREVTSAFLEGKKEAASEHVELPRQNELLPCPLCGRQPVRRDHSGRCGAFWRSKCSVTCDHCNLDLFGWPPADVDARWNKRAPLSDDVKAVKKEGDCGLKEASRVPQNALEELDVLASICTCKRPTVSIPGGGVMAPGPHTDGCVLMIARKVKRILSEHDGLQGAAPVTPKSEYGWLVERGETHAPEYLTIHSGQFIWTKFHVQATRFGRKIDAEKAITGFSDIEGVARICEHSWESVSLPAGSSTEEEDKDSGIKDA